MSPAMRHWLKDQRPFKKVKSKRRNIGGDTMAFFSVPSKHLLVPPAPTRKINQRISGRPKGDIDDFLSSDVERELERSFASTMSIHSPTRNSISSASENENADYVPMDISPAPPRVQPSKSAFLEPKPTGRPRAHTTSARLFGRDMSNASIGSTSGLSLIPSASPGTTSGDKKLQRAALPLEWMMTARPAQPSKNLFAQASHRSGFDQFPGVPFL